MRGTVLVLIAAALVVTLSLAASPPRVTVVTDGVTVSAQGDVTVTVGEVSTSDGGKPTSVPASGTSVPKAGPLVRNAVYAASGILGAFVFQWIKGRYGLSGNAALYAIVALCGALGVGTSALFKDGSVSALVSNPWNVASAGGVAFLAAQLVYKLWIKRGA
ncbi:MAG: hypothetical protein LLG08_04100 [Actinomycetia bacterium]|nr:hypothetical protein [Actinomycetes bacterium]